ncbi:hypothetical protein MRX96_036083 [Rhipicephalus microplus]
MMAGVFLLIVLLLVFAIRPRLAPVGTGLEPGPFCCSTEGYCIGAVVNDLVYPCDDLSPYIYNAAVTTGKYNFAPLSKSLEAMITTAATSRRSSSANSLSKSRAGTFLQKLYATCLVATATKTRD